MDDANQTTEVAGCALCGAIPRLKAHSYPHFSYQATLVLTERSARFTKMEDRTDPQRRVARIKQAVLANFAVSRTLASTRKDEGEGDRTSLM
jgi:hypothetical protein